MLEIKKYYAIWCGPCRMLNPVFDKLQKEFPQVPIHHIDIEEETEFVEQANVRSVPTVIYEKNGVEVERFVGLQSELTYRNAIIEHLNN
jgi:thioredoxin